MNLSDVALLAKEELSLAEKGIASAKVVLTGFVVVFAMLNQDLRRNHSESSRCRQKEQREKG